MGVRWWWWCTVRRETLFTMTGWLESREGKGATVCVVYLGGAGGAALFLQRTHKGEEWDG